MKKIIALALALIMSLSLASVAFAAETTVTTFDQLKDAVAAGGYIKLGADIGVSGDWDSTKTINVSNEVTVDLNGYTLYGPHINSSEKHLYAFSVAEGGTFTLTDTSAAQTGEIKCHYSGVQTKGGTFIMNGGKITAADANMTVAIVNYGGSVVINDGEVEAYHWGIVTQSYFPTSSPAPAITEINGGSVTLNTASNVDESGYGDIVLFQVGGQYNNGSASMVINGGEFDDNGEDLIVYDETVGETAMEVSGGTFSDPDAIEDYLTTGAKVDANGNVYLTANPGEEVVVSTAYPRADYKVKSYDFTTGTKGYKGASYIDEIKINKDNELVIVLKENYKLAEDKTIKGEIILKDKATGAELPPIPVEYTVYNNLEYTDGAKKAKDAEPINGGPNTIVIMDEDGGYVYFTEEMLKGVVKMNAEEKTFLNVIYGGQEETVEAIEELLGEEYLDEAIIEYYEFETRAFKNEVAFSYEAYEDDPHYFYLYNDGKLTKIDATYDDDEDVEAWVWTAIAEGTIIVTDVEIVLADEATKNPDTGANDVVGIAAALAVTSLVAAAAISIKK